MTKARSQPARSSPPFLQTLQKTEELVGTEIPVLAFQLSPGQSYFDGVACSIAMTSS